MRLRSLRKATPEERAGSALYRDAVAAARTPWFYRELGVPDTLDGRFDLIALHAFLLEPTIAARLDLDQTQALLDEMLAAHAPYLPLFQ